MPQEFYHRDEHSLKWQDWVSCLSCFLMLGGMVFSRLLLSIGMILLFLNSLHPNQIRAYWQKFKTSGFAWASLSFFIAYLISGLWSEDKSSWLSVIQTKLPFLFFPFAMFSLPLTNSKWLKIMGFALFTFLLGGMSYSFYFAIFNPDSFSAIGHMPSPMEGDYVRFTIVIVLALMFFVFFINNRNQLKLHKTVVGLLILWALIAIVYIHIQAAKSGLVAFSIFGVAFILDYGIRHKKFRTMFIYLILFAAGEYAFSKTSSVSNQINRYTEEQKVMEVPNDTAVASQTGSVILRLNSYKVATQIIKQHPVTGVGAGDVKQEMDKLYVRDFPKLNVSARIIPHNEFLCGAMAIGIILSLLTLIPMVFLPWLEKNNTRSIYFITTWTILLFGLMIEPMLEVQFGIFVFLFFIYLWTDIPIKQSNVSP
jgi:O-antigen ligase